MYFIIFLLNIDKPISSLDKNIAMNVVTCVIPELLGG
jgi:hypothetical protein